MNLNTRKLNILTSILGYYQYLPENTWEDIPRSNIRIRNWSPNSDDFIEMALKIGAGLPLNEVEKALLKEVVGAWQDNYSSNYDEWEEEDLKFIFRGFEPPTGADVDEIVEEILSIPATPNVDWCNLESDSEDED